MQNIRLRRYPLARVNYGAKEIEAVTRTLESGQTTCGIQVSQFENEFARYVGTKHAAMVNSGSSADLILALGLGPVDSKDTILLPAVTWPTQVWSCLMAGYRVRLIDVDPLTLQMDPQEVLGKIDRHTRAIFMVHLMGLVGEITQVLRLQEQASLGLSILEDCCEALGARWNGVHVGTLGTASAFSFFFSHLISTMEGGMVVTNDHGLDRANRLFRSHGWEPKKDYRYWFPTIGLNVRPTEVQGAFGLVQLEKIEAFRAARNRNVAQLAERTWQRFPDWLHGPQVNPQCEPSWHGFPIMVDPSCPISRDKLCAALDEQGVETRPIVAGNLARQPAVQNQSDRIRWESLPGADAIHDRGFYIGVPSVDDEEGITYVGYAFEKALKG